MDPNDVAQYLKQHPQFFEDYAELVPGVGITLAPAAQPIPIADRQLQILREKLSAIEARMRELIRYGSENDAIGEKLHRSTLALFVAHDLDTTLAVLYQTLQEDFDVPQVAVRLWGGAPGDASMPELAPTSDELHQYTLKLGAPYCGNMAPLETRGWFAPTSRSYAFLPLRTGSTFGLLALASDDPRRFAPGLGTLYLTRLSELASVAAARYFPGN